MLVTGYILSLPTFHKFDGISAALECVLPLNPTLWMMAFHLLAQVAMNDGPTKRVLCMQLFVYYFVPLTDH